MKSLSGFLALFLFAVLPLYAADLSDLTYTTTGGEVTVVNCDKAATGELIIPDTIEENPVTSVGDSAFEGCDRLKSITIPDSVTSIGEGAFFNCSSLTSITIPDSVTSIGTYSFFGCSSLTNITIPDGVTSIGVRAFAVCRNLTSITIHDGVTSIGSLSFEACNRLAAVSFLGDAPKAGREVFKGSTPTIYRKAEAKGWGNTFSGCPVKLISEKP